MNQLQDFGYISYSLDPKTKQLTYQINDWVLKCSGAECKDGAVYATEGYGFLCMPRNITERLVGKRTFEEADAWLDLWCHTTYGDYGNAFSFLAPAIQYHLMCYAPVDLKESFEFVRKVALNGKDEEILKLYYDLEFSLQDIAEGLKITDTQVHERIVRALRKLRHPKYFDLIRYGMKTTDREMIRIESECGFQDGFHRGIEERWEDVNEETGEMNVPESLLVWLERMPVEELQLPIRIINCLHRNKVVTVAELVRLKDKEIMAMNGMGKAAIKDIRKKQSAYIKELLIELVTNEITEISTREVVNVLGEPV